MKEGFEGSGQSPALLLVVEQQKKGMVKKCCKVKRTGRSDKVVTTYCTEITLWKTGEELYFSTPERLMGGKKRAVQCE